MAKISKKKTIGRPQGSPNQKSKYLRDETCSIKCSQGFNKIIAALKKEHRLKSKADVIHEAVQQMAFRTKFTDEKDKYFIDKIQ